MGERPKAGDIVVQPTHPGYWIGRWTDESDEPGAARKEIAVESDEARAYEVAADQADREGVATWLYAPDRNPRFYLIAGEGMIVFGDSGGAETTCPECGWRGVLFSPVAGELKCPSCEKVLGRQWPRG
jgi:hypothetical protein